jgi:FkbM family methyltransferase
MLRPGVIHKKATDFACMVKRVPNIAWARRLLAYEVPYDAVTYDRATKRVSFQHGNINLAYGDSDLILRTFHVANSLSRHARVTFEQQASGAVLARWPAGAALLRVPDEVHILHEILVRGYYDFCVQGQVVVWDIGMNIGLATLAFAAMPCVRAVEGYEPFRPTYERALANFRLNPALADRIQTSNAGIGPEDAVLRGAWSEDCPGNASTTPDVVPFPQDGATQEVTILGAAAVLAEIQRKYPGVTIVAKVDCEGAEYGIIQALHNAGVLSSVGIFMIEWHANGPAELVSLLTSAGFAVLSQATSPGHFGMVYGVNRLAGSAWAGGS